MAARIADEAARLLLELRARLDDPEVDLASVRDDADRSSHELIVRRLAELRPDDPVLSEEGDRSNARLERRRVWVVDPLDGTREFGERDRSDWAVHIALVLDGVATAGAVALPARGLTLTAAGPPVAPAWSAERPRLVVSRTRPPDIALAAAQRLDLDLVPMGSAGAKVMAVVLGEADVYLHAGGQYEWDSAAPVAVAAAAGLHASRLDGAPLRYNRPDPWLPDLLVCRSDLAERVLEAVSGLLPA